ncbi:hypothetical protein ACVWZ8_004819 [Arthrobacter sp. UYCu723]
MPAAKKLKSFSTYFTEADADQLRAAFAAAGHLEENRLERNRPAGPSTLPL